MVLVGSITFMTASIFLGLFDTAVMALMTCLAIDMDMNDGTPKFGPETFHDGVNKINTSIDAHKVDPMEDFYPIAGEGEDC